MQDALSEVLRAIRLSGSLFFSVELRAPYALGATTLGDLRRKFGRGTDHVLPFHMVTEGTIWFGVPGGGPPVGLGPEDIIVLPRGSNHVLLDRPDRTDAVPVDVLMHEVSGTPPTLRHGGDGEVGSAVCGFFSCNARLFNPLLDALPTVMVVRRDPVRSPWLAATLQRAYRENFDDKAGSAALVERMTELLFLEVVQGWLRDNPAQGWFAALADPVVGNALTLLHAEPSRPWTVEQLARRVGTSRSVLAERFSATVGMSVIQYLARWRVELAADRLLSTERSVAEIAAEVGYQSEASLNRAFKRHVGLPPASWRRARTAPQAAAAD